MTRMLGDRPIRSKRYGLLPVHRLAAFLLITSLLSVTNATAQPELHLPHQLIGSRELPASFKVPEHKGSVQQGARSFDFVAPGGWVSWQPWMNPDHITVVQKAARLIERRAINNSACNEYFSSQMPGGRSFAQIWNAIGSDRIRISFSPGPSGLWRAATYGSTSPFDWTITETTVLLGPESVASALVHEATRTNGIGPEYEVAFRAERVCGMAHFLLTEKTVKDLKWHISDKPLKQELRESASR